MIFILGLTGSIGMGKSATADLFRDFAIPVYDADKVVHRLYEREAVGPVGEHFPKAVVNGIVDRRILAAEVLDNPEKLQLLESVVHPLVRRHERIFLWKAFETGTNLAVLDIPLLFETGSDKRCDAVIVVSAPAAVQKQRVLGRDGMTEEKLQAILAKQMPDEEKRRKAHFVIDSSRGLRDARCQVRDILRCLAARPGRTAC